MQPLIPQRYMGTGDNGLMGVGQSKNDTIFEAARGLASEPARAVGAPATEPLNEIFNLSSAGGANVFNVSVNVNGIVDAVGRTMLDPRLQQNCRPELTRFQMVKRVM